MIIYRPTYCPPQFSPDWIQRELERVGDATADVHQYPTLHAAPEKPRVGLQVYADGTDWNPGSGEGLYVYKSGGWTFVA